MDVNIYMQNTIATVRVGDHETVPKQHFWRRYSDSGCGWVDGGGGVTQPVGRSIDSRVRGQLTIPCVAGGDG
jgi:hypothetical protein